ncbi:ABC transporter ATP-binding protein [Candidatus Xianfuyuplasma coldseepsis]|uniref:ABC transporter ATP-binding protein n=1 Tax=Candidatus Xianfuyuplasma coldseepsis TaxID=2782163 RepID=A0A7L7KT46_9MOLU|nr:ABC transporter ATP-binding protein [Xianfuyuplasma coldseepsis]QMS85569.1 ABC transporter ATP-binding protein [Xianfuyuplasma coldseepsis]
MGIKLEQVTKIYTTGEVETVALKDVDLTINDGEVIVLLGPSGSGKSTLLNVCSGLDNPTSGTITIDNDVISSMNSKQLTKFRRNNLGFIFQQYNLLQTLSVRENVEVGREVSQDPFTVEEIVEQVGLTPNIDKYPYQLSGGEQQRVSIARAVVKKPKIMFCDEPTGALDEDNAKEILSVIQQLNETFQTTVVLITHNPNIGVIADRIVKLNSGQVVEVITNANKKRASDIVWG